MTTSSAVNYAARFNVFLEKCETRDGAKRMVAPKRTFEHWHFDERDEGRPYDYVNAGKLMEDFWIEVEKRLALLKEDEK